MCQIASMKSFVKLITPICNISVRAHTSRHGFNAPVTLTLNCGRSSNPDDGSVSIEAKASGTEVLKTNPESAMSVSPDGLEFRTAGPAHKENGPAAVVGMIPELVQAEIKEHVLHE